MQYLLPQFPPPSVFRPLLLLLTLRYLIHLTVTVNLTRIRTLMLTHTPHDLDPSDVCLPPFLPCGPLWRSQRTYTSNLERMQYSMYSVTYELSNTTQLKFLQYSTNIVYSIFQVLCTIRNVREMLYSTCTTPWVINWV